MGPLSANGQNMQKFLAVLAVVALAEGMSVRDQWTSFKATHAKKYSVKENTLRFNIWNANRKMVEEHNAGDHEWTMAMYEWSDWTQEEFAERMLGYQAPENLDSIPRKHFDNAAPSHIDFREEGKVTPAKNQGQCGSCWAFSATGAMEGMWMNSHSTLYSLSEQQMVDCGQGSCNGGYMDSAWQTVRNGANTEADYPYEARDGQWGQVQLLRGHQQRLPEGVPLRVLPGVRHGPGWLLRRHPRGFLLPALQRWHLQRPSVPVRTAQPRCP